MRVLTVILLIATVLLSGCSAKTQDVVDQNAALLKEIELLRQGQVVLMDEIERVNERARLMEIALLDKGEVLKTLEGHVGYLFNENSERDHYYHSRINEVERLHGRADLIEERFIVLVFDIEASRITLEDAKGLVKDYTVSKDCKVLVAGQHFTIFQELEVGSDFIAHTIKDRIKVGIVIRDGIVEQIKM